MADTPYCTRSDVDSKRFQTERDIYKRCDKISQTQDSYSGSATLILENVPGYERQTIYVSGLPGDSGYGSVRFYTKSGSRLNEIENLALEGTKVFNDAFEMGYTPRKAAGVKL